MTAIPLCRASQVQPFSAWLSENGIPTAPLLRDAGLPLQAEAAPDRLIAELPIWKLVEVAGRTQGIEDFGLRVGLGTDVVEIGAFGRAVSTAATLRDSLDVFLREVNSHSSTSAFGLRLSSSFGWFVRMGLADVPSAPIEQYALGLMVQILRLAAGPQWAPDRIWLQAERLPGQLANETFAHTRIYPGAPVTGVSFPEALLVRPLRATFVDSGDALERLRSALPAADLVGSLRQAIESALPGGAPGLDWAAEAANTSTRTLKRRLHECGLSWSGLIDQVRFDTARQLLATGEFKLREVARETGYSNLPNFSRAFRRWSGLAPGQYHPAVEKKRRFPVSDQVLQRSRSTQLLR
jgi:AraC-like DNA-binding protein